jgi:hypothetical protein
MSGEDDLPEDEAGLPEERRERRKLIRGVLEELKKEASRAAGRAILAARTGKADEDISDDEALAAVEELDAPVSPDAALGAEEAWRINRAGAIAALRAARPVLPNKICDWMIGTYEAADAGEVRGLATPAKGVRHGGKPAQYGPLSRRAELGQRLVTATAFQSGSRSLSFDAAVGLVTGVTRDRKPSPHGEPLLPLGGTWDAVWGFIIRARKKNPEMWNVAKAEGEALQRGEPLTPDFVAFHDQLLADAKNDAAWRAILQKARMPTPPLARAAKRP